MREHVPQPARTLPGDDELGAGQGGVQAHRGSDRAQAPEEPPRRLRAAGRHGLHRAHRERGPHRGRDPPRLRIPQAPVVGDRGPAGARARAVLPLPGGGRGGAHPARRRQHRCPGHHHRPGEALRRGARLRPGLHARAVRPHPAAPRGAAAVLLLRPRGAHQHHLRPQGPAPLRGHHRHRADRGAGIDRRQQRAQPRERRCRDHRPDYQPRGGGGDRPAARCCAISAA